MADSELVIGIPEALSGFLGGLMLGLALPRGDWRKAASVGHRDAETVRPANGLDTEKSRLLRGKLKHAVGNARVAPIAFSALRRENDRVKRRLGSSGERAGLGGHGFQETDGGIRAVRLFPGSRPRQAPSGVASYHTAYTARQRDRE